MSPSPPSSIRVLLVEDDAETRRVVEGLLLDEGYVVATRETLAGGLEALGQGVGWDLLLTDVRLPDGSAAALAEAAQQLSFTLPVVAMSGATDAPGAFELARLGVRRFLRKPFSVPDLLSALASALAEAPPLERVAELAVGQHSLPEAQAQVKEAMIHGALERSGGNRRQAAQLLGISRQTVHSLVGPRTKEAGEPEESR